VAASLWSLATFKALLGAALHETGWIVVADVTGVDWLSGMSACCTLGKCSE